MAGLIRIAELAEFAAAARRNFKRDNLGFRASIPTSGSVTQPASVKLRSEYDYLVDEVRAGWTASGTGGTTSDAAAQDVDEMNINFTESGTGETMFSTALELSGLMSGQNCQPVPWNFGEWCHKLDAGTDLSCTMTMRANVTLARVLVVELKCFLVPKDIVAKYLGKK